MNKDLPKWTINNSKYLVDDKYMKLRVDSCTTPQGGTVDKYYVIEYSDWVTGMAYVSFIALSLGLIGLGWAAIAGEDIREMLRDLFSGISFRIDTCLNKTHWA